MLKVLADTMKKTGNLATFGMVEMTFPNNEEVSKKIAEVKGIKLPEVEPMTRQLETFIRRQTFVATQHEVSDMYNEGKPEEAMLLLEKRMAEINAFSLDKFRGKFVRVYRDFYRNIGTAQMKAEDETRRAKIPTGISTIDEITDGGIPRQDTVLLIMRSGVGKSTALKYFSWYNTSIAHNHCLHFQLEGGRDEAVVKFDQMLANTTYAKIMRGDVSDETRQRISALIKRAQTVNSDIDVYASEEMMDMTIADLVAAIEDYKKEYGYYPDLVTVDSIDLLLTGENKKIDFDPNFIKYRLQKCAQRLKDIAKKYDCAVITATQTGDVPIEVWNDPTRVITRQNTEGDRTLIKPFSFVFTGNITIEEGKQNMARIYCDKLRNYRNNGIIIRIPTNYENGFFYDISRSTIVEQVLDMSALDRLESRRSRKGNGEAAVGEKKERVEIAPGVYGTKVVGEGETAAQEPQETLNKRQTKQSLKEYLANKGVQETPKTTRKPVPRKK
jgi:KaiC/GvpD/RAD55 family RecA-like ATPase